MSHRETKEIDFLREAGYQQQVAENWNDFIRAEGDLDEYQRIQRLGVYEYYEYCEHQDKLHDLKSSQTKNTKKEDW